MKLRELQCCIPRSLPRTKMAQVHPLLPLRVDFIKLAVLGRSLLFGHLQPLRFGPPHMLLHAPTRLANIGLVVRDGLLDGLVDLRIVKWHETARRRALGRRRELDLVPINGLGNQPLGNGLVVGIKPGVDHSEVTVRVSLLVEARHESSPRYTYAMVSDVRWLFAPTGCARKEQLIEQLREAGGASSKLGQVKAHLTSL